MKFDSISIQNFKALRQFQASDLGSFVLIAGPNGSGKSCVLDALRVLKSYCGAYVHNELEQLFNEFQMPVKNEQGLAPLFRDKELPVKISVQITFEKAEREFIAANLDRLLRTMLWRSSLGLQRGDSAFVHEQFVINAAQRPDIAENIEKVVPVLSAQIATELAQSDYFARLTIEPGHLPTLERSLVVWIAFSTFDPGNIGIFDYHSATRTYNREPVTTSLAITPGPVSVLRGESALYTTPLRSTRTSRPKWSVPIFESSLGKISTCSPCRTRLI